MCSAPSAKKNALAEPVNVIREDTSPEHVAVLARSLHFVYSALVDIFETMAKTESTMLPLGTPLPRFELIDVTSGQSISAATFQAAKALLVMFICRHCPYVKHVQHQLAQIGKDYANQPVGIVAISSNDAAAYPDDAPDGLRQQAKELGFTFPYCYDETQEVARSFNAVCTPEFYVFDESRKLVYRGQLDESRRHTQIPLTGVYVRSALDAVIYGTTVDPDQRPSIGCSIKWKSS